MVLQWHHFIHFVLNPKCTKNIKSTIYKLMLLQVGIEVINATN